MFSYCENNPCNYFDEDGERLVGVGLQFQFNVGYYTIGFEIVLFFDQIVCGEYSYIVCLYTYGGYSVNLFDVLDPNEYEIILEKLFMAAESLQQDCRDDVVTTSALVGIQQALFGDLSFSASVVLILGNDSFVSILSYTEYFNCLSISGTHWQVTFSESPTCYTISAGYTTSTKPSVTLGSTYYNEPVVLLEGRSREIGGVYP